MKSSLPFQRVRFLLFLFIYFSRETNSGCIVGFNVEEIQLSEKGTVMAWDVGGRSKVRPLYRHYAKDCDVIVWVLDSSDVDPQWNRFDQARDEFHRLLKDEECEGTPVLLLCNKQDLPKAMSPEEAARNLGVFDVVRDRTVRVVGISATTGQGLDEAKMALQDLLLVAKKDEKLKVKSKIQISPSIMAPVRPDYGVTKTEGNQTLERFAVIQNNTECPFAKAAKLWGGSPVKENSSLEDQAMANAAALYWFVYECKHNHASLDGYCLEVDHPSARNGGPREFGDCVRKLLTALSDLDHAKEFVMRVKYIGNRGWRFRFGGIDFFVTTFAPCYPPTSSRYAFGSQHAFLLLQPELSFARHQLPPDTAVTHWEEPHQTIRDKTRVAYHAAGRAYAIPTTTKYPPAEHIVKPLHDDGVTVIRWWEEEEETFFC